MASIFNSVKGLHPKRNAFSSHSYRNDFTSPCGVIVPVYQQHCVPGSRVRLSAHALIRTQPLVAPLMDNLDYYVHFWQIPYRLLENDQFTAWLSGEIDDNDYHGQLFMSPNSLSGSLMDYLKTNGDYSNADCLKVYEAIFGNGGLFDMLGYDRSAFAIYRIVGDLIVKQTDGATYECNFRPLAAYLMLMLHWYINENIPPYQDFVEDVQDFLKYGFESTIEDDYLTIARILLGLVNMNYINGSTDSQFCSFMGHGWAKDYATSALPNVQYGSPTTISLAGTAPVSIPSQIVDIGDLNLRGFKLNESIPASSVDALFMKNPSLITESPSVNLVGEEYSKTITDIVGNIQKVVEPGTLGNITGTADLSNVSVISINELRFANALQVFKERQMRFGRRRLEYYKGFFDVTPEDLRLQVPKYLGGGKLPINISDIEQTSATEEGSPLGRIAGKGTAVAAGFAGFTTWCSEETIIIGLGFAMPKVTYSNGISRMLLKTNDRYDYFNPSFEHLGEQAITKNELYARASGSAEFGYTPRYTEYRFHANEQHGDFKSTLSYWTLGRIFTSAPSLNRDFIYMKPSNFDRIFAYSGISPLLISLKFSVRIVQPVSKYGTPMLLA